MSRDFVPNLRDIGGIATDDGSEVLHGRVLRSAMPSAKDLIPEGIVWPPALVIDLRSDGESEPIHPLAVALLLRLISDSPISSP